MFAPKFGCCYKYLFNTLIFLNHFINHSTLGNPRKKITGTVLMFLQENTFYAVPNSKCPIAEKQIISE